MTLTDPNRSTPLKVLAILGACIEFLVLWWIASLIVSPLFPLPQLKDGQVLTPAQQRMWERWWTWEWWATLPVFTVLYFAWAAVKLWWTQRRTHARKL